MEIEQAPHYAFFHAEVTVLTRAARDNNGTLAGKIMDVSVSRPMCNNCRRWLPRIGLQLGNPTLYYTDPLHNKYRVADGVLRAVEVAP